LWRRGGNWRGLCDDTWLLLLIFLKYTQQPIFISPSSQPNWEEENPNFSPKFSFHLRSDNHKSISRSISPSLSHHYSHNLFLPLSGLSGRQLQAERAAREAASGGARGCRAAAAREAATAAAQEAAGGGTPGGAGRWGSIFLDFWFNFKFRSMVIQIWFNYGDILLIMGGRNLLNEIFTSNFLYMLIVSISPWT